MQNVLWQYIKKYLVSFRRIFSCERRNRYGSAGKRHVCQRFVCCLSTRKTLVVFTELRIRHCAYLLLWKCEFFISEMQRLDSLPMSEGYKKRKEKNKAANEGVGPVFRYQAFSLLLLFPWKAKCQTISTPTYGKIYFHACARKSMNFVNRIYRERPISHPRLCSNNSFSTGHKCPYVKSKYSLIDRRLSWPVRGFIVGGLGRVGFSPCSVYLTGRQLVQICVVLHSRARQNYRMERMRRRKTLGFLRAFLRVDSHDARFRLRACTFVVISIVSRTWLRGRIVVSAQRSRERKTENENVVTHVRSESWV